ncbi:MAG: hypothetical protein M4579_001302 [Chaenotheca gracillima]|nr:MAG: hypothetical protein M4579_001302 [Chaenotheca gracillima]
MNDLAVSFFVALAGHVLNVYAQVKDQYQSFNGNPVSFLNCYGDPDITQDVLFGAAPADFTMTPRWAQFCALSEATQLCGYDRDPTHFYFDGIGLPHYDRPGVDQIEIHRAIQICYIKCSCINTDPTKALDRITPDNRERIFEFNFDYGLAVQYPSLLPDDTPVYVYGFGGVSETDEDEYEFSDEEEDEYRVPRGEQTDAPISAHAYVGAPSNRPVCDESINLAEEMPMSFFHFVHAHVTPGVTLTATSFCAHSFFGGADRSNMGAICKNPSQNEKPVLSIDDIRKAVQYTTDFYPRSLYISLAVSLATSFCHAFCTCSEDSIQDQVESKAAWESAKQGMPPSTGSDSRKQKPIASWKAVPLN